MNESRKRLRTAAGVGLAFLTGIAVFAGTFAIIDHFRPRQMQPLIAPGERRAAGPLALPILDADEKTEWSLEALRGKVVVVNYFATWCEPCIEELPDLMKLGNEYKTRGVEFALVSMDKDDEESPGTTRETVLRRFVKARGILFPILLPPGNSLIWSEGFPIPQTFIFDKQGRQAQFLVGQVDERDLRNTLETLLKEPS